MTPAETYELDVLRELSTPPAFLTEYEICMAAYRRHSPENVNRVARGLAALRNRDKENGGWVESSQTKSGIKTWALRSDRWPEAMTYYDMAALDGYKPVNSQGVRELEPLEDEGAATT